MSSAFQWDQYQPKAPPEEKKEEGPSFDWNAYQSFSPATAPEEKKSLTQGAHGFLKESEELERDIERNQARGTSRMIERTLGFPGDVAHFLEYISGRELGKSSKKRFHLGAPPTSASLKEKSEKLTSGYTSPKNKLEEETDEFLGDVASMMLPGGKGYSVAKTIGIPLIGALAKQGIKYASGDEQKAGIGKAALMFALDLMSSRRATVPRGPGIKGFLNMGGPQKYVNSLFQAAEESLPKGVHMVDAKPLELALSNLQTSLMEGGTQTSRAKALQAISEMQARIHDGKINVHELPAFRRRINEDIEQLGGWDFTTPPKIRKRAINNLSDVKKKVIDAGEEYGRTQNPAFLENWKNANQAQSVLSSSNVASNFIQKTIGDKILSKGVKSLFGIGIGGAAAHKLGSAASITSGIGAAGVSGLYMGAKTLYRIAKSPTLRKYYTNTITAALNGQKDILLQNITALDDALKEEEKD